MQWPRQLVTIFSLQRPRVSLRPVCVGHTVDKVALGEVFLQILQSSLSAESDCAPSSFTDLSSVLHNLGQCQCQWKKKCLKKSLTGPTSEKKTNFQLKIASLASWVFEAKFQVLWWWKFVTVCVAWFKF